MTASEPHHDVDATAGARRVLTIRQGDRPRLNADLAGRLADTFPEFVVDDLDVLAEIRADRPAWARSVAGAAVEFARPVARRRLSAKAAVVRSASFGRQVAHLVAERVSPATHAFTFQSQSLFSADAPGVPHFVYTDHAHLANLSYPGFDRSRLLGGRQLAREAAVYERADGIFVRSEHVADVLTSAYGIPAERIAVVGVGPNIASADRRTTTGWHDGRVIFVGVDWERKGGPILVDAFRQLRIDHPHARLEIVGCTPAIETPGVTVHGRLPAAEVAALLGECDIFCLPTLAEPFGVAFVEAMLAGLPIVGTDIGAVPDLVDGGRAGLLVRPGSVADLRSRLDGLIRDPDHARRLGAHGRSIASQRYEWEPVLHRIRDRVLETLTRAGPVQKSPRSRPG